MRCPINKSVTNIYENDKYIRSRCELESENAALSATIDEIAALNEKANDEAIRLQAEVKNLKGALRTMASEYVKDHPILNEPEDVKAIGTEQRIRLMIASALAHPAALDEISSKDYGADGVGLTHAEIDKLSDDE